MRQVLTILDIGDESIDWTNVLPLSHYIAKRLTKKANGKHVDEELLDRARQAFAWQMVKARKFQKKGEL